MFDCCRVEHVLQSHQSAPMGGSLSFFAKEVDGHSFECSSKLLAEQEFATELPTFKPQVLNTLSGNKHIL